MATRPDPPTDIMGLVSSSALTISWRPATTGGQVSSFTAIGLGFPRSISIIVDSTVSTANIVAVNGTSYIPTVIANGVGNAGSSIIPGAIIPATVPGAPTAVRVTYNKTSGFATITWNAPGFTGGLQIISYIVESSPPGISTTVSVRNTTVGGFTYGTPYTFTVRAINSKGSSAPSNPSASFIPLTLPPAPTNTASVLISSGMNISWVTPILTGGTPLTEYAILNYTNPSTFTTINLPDSTISSVTLSTLANGVSYNFGVMSRNQVGFSPVSPLTSSVLYYDEPFAPSPVVASRISTTSSILVSWADLPENYLISSFIVTSVPPTTVISTTHLSTVISNLSCGTPYTFSVRANNLRGTSATATMATGIIPLTIPNPPSSIQTVAGVSRITVSWTTPTFNGGTEITGYNITPYDSTGNSGTTVSTTASVLTTDISSFTGTMPYRFGVSSRNIVGYSETRITQTPVSLLGLPGAPTNTASVLTSSGMNISWVTPILTGGTPLTEYAILNYTNPSTFTTINLTDATISSVTLSTLANGVSYNFGVMARNEVGFSPISPLTSSVLYYNAPVAPSPVVASRISTTSSILVSWTDLPENYLISSFIVTSVPPTTVISTASLSTVISNLSCGTPYTFSVRANNLRGTSATATMATEIIPLTIPNPPSSIQAVAGLFRATVSWTTPTFNGGTEITGYNITPHDSSGNSGTTVSTTGSVLTTDISSLTATIPYNFGVSSRNIVGYSETRITPTPITVIGMPGAPTGLSIITKNTAAIVNWTPPSGNGLPISSYTFNTTPAGGSTVYYDSSGSSAVIGSLVNGTTYTILMNANTTAGAGPVASTTVTPTSNIVVPAYIPNPGLVTGPRIYAQSGPYVSIFADSNFQNFSYGIPVGTWSTLSNITTLQGLTAGATTSTISGNVSVVFPQGGPVRNLKLNNGENFSGSKEVIYRSTSATSLLSGAGGQFSTIASGDWDYARSVSLGSPPNQGPPEMVLNITIPVTDPSFAVNNYAQVTLGFTFETSNSITIDWGDTTTPDTWTNSNPTHNYTTAGSYAISITGTATGQFKGFLTNPIQNSTNLTEILKESKLKHPATYLTSVSSFGHLGLSSLSGAFSGCINLVSVPTILPYSVTDISYMFSAARIFTQNLGTWDVTSITNARGIFDNTCPMLSSTGANYPPFSSAFTTTNPYNGTYYGRTNLPMAIMYNLQSLDNSINYTPSYIVSVPIGDNINDIIIVEWDKDSSGNGIFNVYKPRENLTQQDPTYFIALHEYKNKLNGYFTVNIYGTSSRTRFGMFSPETGSINTNFNEYSRTLREISSWGNVFTNITDMTDLFMGCANLFTVPSSLPSTVTILAGLFLNCTTMNQDLYTWDVSNVTNMSRMFQGCTYFNKDINSWNVSNVTDMSNMFGGCVNFNQSLNSWNVSNVTNMFRMFEVCFKFNGDISSWNVGNVTNMFRMFSAAREFNQPLNSWNVSKVTDMSWMFSGATVFNQPLNSWIVSNVTDMSYMFTGAWVLNQPLNSWNVGKVTNMREMFGGARVFNQPLNSWNVTNVTDMGGMFTGARVFNQDLSSWTPTSVTDATDIFNNTKVLRQNAKYPQFSSTFQATRPYNGYYYGSVVAT